MEDAFWTVRGGRGFGPRLDIPAMELQVLVERDIALTERALGKAILAAPKRSHLPKIAEDFWTMPRPYLDDAKHFRDQADLDKALAHVTYAPGRVHRRDRLAL